MAEPGTLPANDQLDLDAIARAHETANKEALLEHARMGRPVSIWRDGKIVKASPTEVFSWYGLDEFGRPKPQ